MHLVYTFTDTYASDAPANSPHINTFGITQPLQDLLFDIEIVSEVENADPAHDVDPLSGVSLLQKIEIGYNGETPFQTLQGEGSFYYLDTVSCDEMGKTPLIETDVLPVAITGSATYYQSVTAHHVGLIPEHGKKGLVKITLGADTDIVTTAANIILTSVKVTVYGIPYNREIYEVLKSSNNLYRIRTSSPYQKTINGSDKIMEDVLDEGKDLIGWILDGYNASTVVITGSKLQDGQTVIFENDYYGYQTQHNLNTNAQMDLDTFINCQVVILEDVYNVNSSAIFYVSTSGSDVFQLTMLYRELVN